MTSVRPVGGDAPGGAGTRSAGGRNAGEQDREVVWEFEIEPDSDGDVTVSLGAICTADGRSLSEGISTTVEGPDTGPTGLTAAFEGLPVAHDGEGGIRFRVAFSEDIGISYRSLREDAFTVTGGRVTGGRRVDDRRDLFEMTVRPDADGDVTITLPAGRDCAVSEAICTKGENRRTLTNSPSATVAGPDGGLNGGGLLQMGLGGGDLLTGSAFAMNRETRHGGILSFWSRGAQSSFAGREGALSLGGDVRTTMVGADYAKGPLVAGLSLSHSRGLGEYAGVAGGQVASSVTGLYPWLGYQATERVTVWGVAGYGAGGLRLTPQGGPALEAGLSMAMAAAGTRSELVAGGSGGFALAFKADALWVGTATGGVDGPAGRLQATEAAVTRFRTGLEGARAYTLAGRVSLRPSVEVGLRHDGGDAETGAGMDVGAGLIVSDASTGLAVDVRVLVVHQAAGFRVWGMAVSLSYNPTPSTPLCFVARRVAPSWGGGGHERGRGAVRAGDDGGDGARRRCRRHPAQCGGRLRAAGGPLLRGDAAGRRQHLRIRARLPAGHGLTVAQSGAMHVELGVDAHRRESPKQGGVDTGVLGRAALG